MTRHWRIATQGPSWRADDLSGQGAANDPGRWNSLGLPVVYTSTSIALACLETVVHVTGDQGLPLRRWLVAIDVPAEHWQQRLSLEPTQLLGWDATPAGTSSRRWGDRWLLGQGSLIALVPSVIVPEECNALINPAHPGASSLMPTMMCPGPTTAGCDEPAGIQLTSRTSRGTRSNRGCNRRPAKL